MDDLTLHLTSLFVYILFFLFFELWRRRGFSIYQPLTLGFLLGSVLINLIKLNTTLNFNTILFSYLLGIIIAAFVFFIFFIFGNSSDSLLPDNKSIVKIVKKHSHSFVMGLKKNFIHFMGGMKSFIIFVMELVKIFILFIVELVKKIILFVKELVKKIILFVMELVKNFIRIFFMFPISTKYMRIFSICCFVTGLFSTLVNIMERSESIIINKLLNTNHTVRPEMIILPLQNALHDIPKNTDNAITLAISRTEITFENYFFVVRGDINDIMNKSIMDKPVRYKNVIDPRLYCNILSDMEGLEQCYYSNKKDIRKCNGYRLPTKNEWMYAAFAYTSIYYHPSLSSLGWFSNNSAQIHEVAKKKANAWGLYDTFGNVSELIHTSPYNADNSSSFTHIGCSFMDEISDYCIDDHKVERFEPKNDTIGFRIVRSIFPK